MISNMRVKGRGRDHRMEINGRNVTSLLWSCMGQRPIIALLHIAKGQRSSGVARVRLADLSGPN